MDLLSPWFNQVFILIGHQHEQLTNFSLDLFLDHVDVIPSSGLRASHQFPLE